MWRMSCSAAVTNRHSLPDHLSLIPIQPFHPRPFHATTAVGVLFALAPCPSPDIDVGSGPVVGSVLIVLAWRMGSNARWSEDWAITGMIMRYCIPIGLTASASYDDHITGGPGAPGMADIGSPIIPTEMSPTSSSNVTPNMDLPTPNPANDNRPGPDAFSASGLTFNADGSINFGLVDEAGAYNAGFGLDPASASGSVGTHAIMRRGH
ncbi:hypothetical protein RHS04_09313 [Rhizoctonia solani]|uniref:Uncharacterized protein n=1 Tax=Rhizoctonia solani TaxID=456999 RepID=A0A8H7GY91_9AGAM|nr:hypothetical protein RHS04_09313 [Rhizoctonia solani]